MNKVRTVHVRVEGCVQGVFYRAWTESTARDLHVKGWVRNRKDGSVEMMLQGAPEAIATMLDRCHHGPPDANVAHISVSDKADDHLQTFQVLPTL